MLCKIIFILVYCNAWASYVEDEQCIDKSLLENGWADMSSLNVSDSEKKSLLINQLNKHIDGKVHTFPELSVRPVIGPKGSLCGIAAIHQALRDTIISTSELTTMSHKKMRLVVMKELDLDPADNDDMPDKKLLEMLYQRKSTNSILKYSVHPL